jgi:hypothetical protein
VFATRGEKIDVTKKLRGKWMFNIDLVSREVDGAAQDEQGENVPAAEEVPVQAVAKMPRFRRKAAPSDPPEGRGGI